MVTSREEGPRGILHTGSRDSAAGHEGPRKTRETYGGGKGMKAIATTAPKKQSKFHGKKRGPSGPEKEVILRQSNVLKSTEDRHG